MSANVRPGPRTAELNGLNWQVQVPPLSLSMTSLPPTLPVDAVDELVVDVVDELPPHAASTRHATGSETSHLKRLICTLMITTLSFPCDAHRLAADHHFGKLLNKSNI